MHNYYLDWILPPALTIAASAVLDHLSATMFTADLIDAATAEKFGMVNHVCEDEVLKDEVYKMASRLAKSAPLSIGLTKKYLNDTDLTMDEVLAIEETTQPLLMGTDDCKEGIAAFYEKREAVFTGK